MPGAESLYPPDWLRIANKDVERAERNLAHDDAAAAGFYLQQAVEKYLKAYLLSNGWKLKRTHDLSLLIDAAIAYDPQWESFRISCERITGYYVVERYPLEEPKIQPHVEQVRLDLEAAHPLIKKLKEALGG